MRFKEFITEAPPNPEDSGGPARGTVAAAQADAARIAQGQKNLNSIKGFFGAKPEELKDAPAGASIDPVQRARMGYKPASQKEIADFQAANPNYGKVVGRDGQPIKTGDGSDLVSGGGAAVVQTAQAAAPQSKGDAHAGQGGTEQVPDTGDEAARLAGRNPAPGAAGPSATPYAGSQMGPGSAAIQTSDPTAAKPAAGAGGYGTGMNNPSVAPAAGTTGASSTDAATAAAADAGRAAIKSDETSKEIADISRLSKTTPAEAPAPAPAAAAVPAAAVPAAAVPTPAPAAAAVPPPAGGPPGFAGVSAAAPASGGDASALAGAMRDKTPTADATNFDKMSFGQAFKAARGQGLKTFPWKGGSYSTAQKGEDKALDAGIARNAEQRANAGKPGHDEASRPGGGVGTAPAAAAPAPAPAAAPAAPPQSRSAAPAPAAAASAAKPVFNRQSQTAVKESQEINRMRFLAGLKD